MRKKRDSSQSKTRKNYHDAKFEQMVSEYNDAKAILESMDEGSVEHIKQQKYCDTLFANAEKFFKQHN
ncbi:hypothetical protein [Shewanella sp.]|uniref:hypothetical protein n=1 Tax=Shewanella sp. TaxID=50422 RepID=UPI003A972308